MAKKMKNAQNGLKMILANVHHIELPPKNSTWAGTLNMGKKMKNA